MQNQWQEAKEEMGEMLRFTEQPSNPQDTSIYLGPTIEGQYVGKKVNIGKNDSNIYEIKMAGDRLVNMWGSKLIDGKFSVIPFNSQVHVQYLGKKEPVTAQGRAYHDFQIMFPAPVGASLAPAMGMTKEVTGNDVPAELRPTQTVEDVEKKINSATGLPF